jgi:hypothetical protein
MNQLLLVAGFIIKICHVWRVTSAEQLNENTFSIKWPLLGDTGECFKAVKKPVSTK